MAVRAVVWINFFLSFVLRGKKPKKWVSPLKPEIDIEATVQARIDEEIMQQEMIAMQLLLSQLNSDLQWDDSISFHR